MITLHETWAEVTKENCIQLSKLACPVAQIVSQTLLAVGSRIILAKNQGNLTPFGLNNGAMGRVVAILSTPDRPPSMPDAVICDVSDYRGPTWLSNQPTWVPIVPITTRCENNCCSRTGLPIMSGYSILVAKSQGMTVGANKPATHMRIKLQSEIFMESLSLGTTYTAFSRVESESRWCLVEKIPQDRINYMNQHPRMTGRREEEKRLQMLSEKTVSENSHYLDENAYIEILQELDEHCNDGIRSSICSNPNDNCICILCKQK